jgi:hypothetical protein
MDNIHKVSLNELGKLQLRPYVLCRKSIKKGSITECTNGCRIDEETNEFLTRPVNDLVAVLVIDPRPSAGRGYEHSKFGVPIYVIGVRETDSDEKVTIHGEGFVHHPKHNGLYTSGHASGLIPLDAFHRFMDIIITADDVVELQTHLRKFYRTP